MFIRVSGANEKAVYFGGVTYQVWSTSVDHTQIALSMQPSENYYCVKFSSEAITLWYFTCV